jgi:hypothetical protein
MPNHITHAAEVQAQLAAEKFAIPVRTTARQALRDELDRTYGLVLWLQARCQELADKGELAFGVDQRTIRPAGQARGGQAGQPQLHEIVQRARQHPYAAWLERERKHLAAVAAEMERIGIEKRMATVDEELASQVLAFMDRVLGDLDLTADQQAKLAQVIPLRAGEMTGDA